MKSERTRQRILEAVATELRLYGYAGMRLVEVAARADMKAGSLYYHFDSREDLVQAVLSEGTERTHRHVAAQLAQFGLTSPIERVSAAITAHIEVLHLVSDFASASIRNVGQLPDALRDKQRAAQAGYEALWRTLIKDAADAGAIRADHDLEATAMLILGMLNWTTEWFEHTSLSPVELANTAVDLVLGGLLLRPTA